MMTYTTAVARSEYRAALVRWIADFKPSLYVTFVFNSPISPRSAKDRLDAFHARMDRTLLGPKWQAKPEDRARFIGFVEKAETNIHVHAVFDLPTKQDRIFVEKAPSIWKELAPAGNIDIQTVTYAEGVADYITKEIRPDTCEQMLLPRHQCAAPTAA
ncbi:MAG: hypothetical protein AB7E05_13870 [Sphingobium sp.]